MNKKFENITINFDYYSDPLKLDIECCIDDCSKRYKGSFVDSVPATELIFAELVEIVEKHLRECH